MDVDYTYMDASKKKKLMKPSSCFCCKKQGHLAREYSSKGMTLVQEVKIEKTPVIKKGKAKEMLFPTSIEESPSYSSLFKQINVCNMKDRQKILELFSNDGGSKNEDF